MGDSSLTSTSPFCLVRNPPAQSRCSGRPGEVCASPGPLQLGPTEGSTSAHASGTATASHAHPPFTFHCHLDGSGDVAPAVLACLLFCSERRSIHEPPPQHRAMPCQPSLSALAAPASSAASRTWVRPQPPPPRFSPQHCWGGRREAQGPSLLPPTHCCSDSRTPGPWGC